MVGIGKIKRCERHNMVNVPTVLTVITPVHSLSEFGFKVTDEFRNRASQVSNCAASPLVFADSLFQSSPKNTTKFKLNVRMFLVASIFSSLCSHFLSKITALFLVFFRIGLPASFRSVPFTLPVSLSPRKLPCKNIGSVFDAILSFASSAFFSIFGKIFSHALFYGRPRFLRICESPIPAPNAAFDSLFFNGHHSPVVLFST